MNAYLLFFIYVVMLIIGFVLLVKGADWFVDGAAALANTLKVPGVIIGLTVVAMGTSAPELAVSITSAISKSNGLCLGNVIGSNMFNLLMVLGVCAVIMPMTVEREIMRRDYPISIAVTVLIAAFVGFGALFSGGFTGATLTTDVATLGMSHGIIMIVCFVAYIILTIVIAVKNREEGEAIEDKPVWKSLLLLVVGIVCIVLGGNLVVDYAKKLAYMAGMSETLVGLTIVAVGTSLPELVTSIVASRKGQNGMAVGNVVGSNIFNILLILGVSCLINPIAVALETFIDMVILLVMNIIVMFFCANRKIVRGEGAVMVVMYLAYMAFAVVRAYI
jgi:cation:H+ antiporter